MSNIKQPASSTAKVKKLLLFADDPLTKILKPDYYRIVGANDLEVLGLSDNLEDPSKDPGDPGDDPKDPPEDPGEENKLKAPSLSDITFVSATMVTDKNKNQFVEFVFNVKNSVGESVIGVEGYGQ